MNERHIARLESQLERLVEGVFTQLFGGRHIRTQDVALQLARALEDHSVPARDGDPRPIAPDEYFIYLHSTVQQQLLRHQPHLPKLLSQHMIELATQSGYRLHHPPSLFFMADDSFALGQLQVRAGHSDAQRSSTAAMQRVDIPVLNTAPPPNAQLMIGGARAIPLTHQMLTIGRERDNQVVLDDPMVSRYHAQLRLRSGAYLLFDTNSKGGTFVNNVAVKEHRLQSGDVIRIGRTQLIYLDDQSNGGDHPGTGTSELSPIE